MLGPLQVEVDGEPASLGGPGQRRLLSALLAAGGQPMPDTSLAELVWGADAPPVINGALQVSVSRLRSALGPKARDRLARTALGYRFAVAAEQTDAGRFTQLVSEGDRLRSAGDPAGAVRAYREALPLWRGEPWSELGASTATEGPRAKLAELREVAVEELQAARLATGDTAGAVAALTEAVAASPYRERRWELLILGLYRAGRQGHALAELRRVRELLADELGVDPGPGLRELERRLLNHDPRLLIVESPAPSAPVAPEAADRSPVLASPPEPARGHRPLTRPLSSFIGRQADLDIVAEALREHRLVSLIGPAGVGKTRLAVEHALTTPRSIPVWLSDVPNAGALVPTLAEALGVRQSTEEPAPPLHDALREQPTLVVLDNCEHLTGPVAELVIGLLRDCPELRILATSREPLGVDGECTVPVAPLDVDGPAVTLLLDRVRAGRPGWRPSATELTDARRICTALDGLPLAIELAAARERALGLAELATHLSERDDVLGTPPRGSLSPHATLHSAIAWSVGLLTPADRALLLRLWPFEGGFEWPAADAVQPTGTIGQPVLATLASLVDRSVVQADLGATPTRYRLLFTVRGYCRQADPDPAASREAHARWVRRFVHEQIAHITGPKASSAYRALAAELPNIRAGIQHDLANRPVDALRTAAALEWVWVAAGVPAEGLALIRDAMAKVPDAPPSERVKGLLAQSIVTFHSSQAESTIRFADEALALIGTDRDGHPMLAKAMLCRAAGTVLAGEPEAALRDAGRLAVLAARDGQPDWLRGVAWMALGAATLLGGDRVKGEQMLLRARRTAARCGHQWTEGTVSLMLAWNLIRPDDTEHERSVHWPRGMRALCALQHALEVFTELHNVSDALGVLYAGAYALALAGRPADGVRLRAAVVTHAARRGAGYRRFVHLAGPGFERHLDDALSPDERAAAEKAGAEADWAEMLELFQAGLPEDTKPLALTAAQTGPAAAAMSSALRMRSARAVSRPSGVTPATPAMSSIRPMPPAAPQ
ncbi:putative ATPase/DNA-binding SARP family transcriptional activator [Pseudonocardia eucalypti]|uniref:BTAD domain-containing putative transcriptional regulator n=1 Tax=Pseudonocardia eucalypti TaxID=648755 RepID=UPI00161F6BE4|nr:putative ATPase/DNA-binding SARP family transcriptional activator [Pseudonocardia eucalypti]